MEGSDACGGPNGENNVRACSRVGDEGMEGWEEEVKERIEGGDDEKGKGREWDRAVPYIESTRKATYAR